MGSGVGRGDGARRSSTEIQRDATRCSTVGDLLKGLNGARWAIPARPRAGPVDHAGWHREGWRQLGVQKQSQVAQLVLEHLVQTVPIRKPVRHTHDLAVFQIDPQLVILNLYLPYLRNFYRLFVK